jgi:hypothetical protein
MNQQQFTATPIKKYEYLSIRYDYKGRGITQEFNLLDINGERKVSWNDDKADNIPNNLPQFLNMVGSQGWELVSHVVNQDNRTNGVTLHYMHFKRSI